METMVIDMIVEDNLIKIPRKFKNKRVKIIIIDSEEKEKEKKSSPITRKLNFKIDEPLEDVIPFSDIKDSKQFVEKLRKEHW